MSKNTVSIENLHDSNHYEPLEEVNYHDLLPFLLKYIKPQSFVMWLFYVLNILFLAIILFFLITNIIHTHISILGLLNYFGLAGLITVASVPFHELIHGLAFKLLGAGKLTFGANLKQFMFYVTAHRFVMNQKQFFFLALLPFVVISSLCIYFLFDPSFTVRWISANVLFAHSTCCVGDFALMSYFQVNCQDQKGYTYDDVPSMTSFFFIEKK
jgi:hypothetical protein